MYNCICTFVYVFDLNMNWYTCVGFGFTVHLENMLVVCALLCFFFYIYIYFVNIYSMNLQYLLKMFYISKYIC